MLRSMPTSPGTIGLAPFAIAQRARRRLAPTTSPQGRPQGLNDGLCALLGGIHSAAGQVFAAALSHAAKMHRRGGIGVAALPVGSPMRRPPKSSALGSGPINRLERRGGS